MKVAIAQINPTLGDFQGNRSKILQYAKNVPEGTEIVLFPEMTLFGYHPGDLLERTSIVDLQTQHLEELIAELPKDLYCLFGCVQKNNGKGKAYFNSAVLVKDGAIQQSLHKQLLPVYDVFDDSRHFHPGRIAENIFTVNDKKILVLVCEDMWGWDPIHAVNPIETLQENVDLVLNLSASPFTPNKAQLREKFAAKTATHLKAPLVYTNMVGAQDELIYDGGSFAMTAQGKKTFQGPYFKEFCDIVDSQSQTLAAKAPVTSETQKIKEALVLGLRDYAKKTGFKKVHLGLSGGIDSAVVACLAAEAFGGENLSCVAMPSSFNADMSLNLAKDLASRLKAQFSVLPIQEGFDSLIGSFEKTFGDKKFSLVHENMQARIRGLFLMAFSNDNNSLLLSTGNKSEYATGYTTLYGDMCGGLAVIGDLLKSQVYDIANLYGELKQMPQGIIDRPPSAELRPNQKDSDSLPPYSELDNAVEKLVCQKEVGSTETENWVVQRLMLSEFKRWQAPPILKVSAHAFGQGRRMPIAHKARV